VNEDQHEIGNLMAKWLLKEMGTKGNVIEVRGVAGNPVDLDRHKGLHELLDKEKDIKVVEVVGNWDDGTAQRRSQMRLRSTGSLTACHVRVVPRELCAR
jgi:ABC-type sugar transport system, periplasmic component